jgi:hypothetical protein
VNCWFELSDRPVPLLRRLEARFDSVAIAPEPDNERRRIMKNLGFATLAATALTAGALGLAAPALAAPSGNGDALETISSLEDQGYKVVVNRQSTAALADANVVSVGEGPSFSHNVAADGSSSDYMVPVTTRTIYVNVK